MREHVGGLGAETLDVCALVVVGQGGVVAPAFEQVERLGMLQVLVQVVLFATGFLAGRFQQAAQQRLEGVLLARLGDQRGDDVKGSGHIRLLTRAVWDGQMIGYFRCR